MLYVLPQEVNVEWKGTIKRCGSEASKSRKDR